MSSRQLFAIAALVLFVAGCAHVPPPVPEREFRGVWLTTVNNADWPSRPGLSTDVQKRELMAILDCAAATHLNAVIMHIRPNADAFYASDIEPWSDYLSGDLGKPPDPYYDPLAFAIEEAHKRGLELHAWLNPYRTRHPLTIPLTSPEHMSLAHPEFVHQYGRMWWLDPGEPLVRAYIVRIVRDIVRRYDVDAIHFDDYFYPYPEKGIDFPDEDSYRRWNDGMTRDDWRRRNVDLLIEEVSRAIKEEKPDVRFGVSPFGIWRPKHPRHVRGLDAYAQIYADSRKWLQRGWVDYLTPQLYWGTTVPQQRFSELLRWWRRQNRLRIHLWPGLGAHRVANGRPNAFTAEEIIEQINLIRRGTKDPGYILFTANVLMRDRGGLTDKLERLNAKDVRIPANGSAKTRVLRPMSTTMTTTAQAEIAQLDTEYQAAVERNDAATMDRILADGFILVTGLGKTYTKQDLLEEARSGRVHYELQRDSEQTVRVWGDTAVITALLRAKGTDSGAPFDYKLWFSDTYVRTPAGWRYVFGQASTRQAP